MTTTTSFSAPVHKTDFIIPIPEAVAQGNADIVDIGLVPEIARARAKFPTNRALFSALMEEVGELARELDKGIEHIDPLRVIAEARQVACVAIRIASEGTQVATENHLVYASAKIGESLARKHLAAIGQEV